MAVEKRIRSRGKHRETTFVRGSNRNKQTKSGTGKIDIKLEEGLPYLFEIYEGSVTNVTTREETIRADNAERTRN